MREGFLGQFLLAKEQMNTTEGSAEDDPWCSEEALSEKRHA